MQSLLRQNYHVIGVCCPFGREKQQNKMTIVKKSSTLLSSQKKITQFGQIGTELEIHTDVYIERWYIEAPSPRLIAYDNRPYRDIITFIEQRMHLCCTSFVAAN